MIVVIIKKYKSYNKARTSVIYSKGGRKMKWTRKELKEKAKQSLKAYYWEALLAILIASLLSGGISFKIRRSNYQFTEVTNTIYYFSSFFILLNIFVLNIINAGLAKFFIEGEKEDAKISNLFFFFNKDYYFNAVKIMFFMNLYTFLWSLLFIIPGIIKSYEYIFIPYLLAENPNIDMDEVFRETKSMTDGQKWDMFVLDLSFIGWYFLGSLVIIGQVFVAPYHQATKTQLYLALKNEENNQTTIFS